MCRTTAIVVAALSLLLLPAVSPALYAADAHTAEPDKTPDCVYVGTPYDVIDKMLDVADIKQDNVVYDLGCGDGRIIVAAAKRFGCHGVGYDIDPQRIRESLENVRKERVEKLVEIKQEDIFTVDLSRANVLMLYLLPEMNARLIPQFKQLKPGSQIVTHNYTIEGIAYEKSFSVKSLEDGDKHTLFLYVAPLKTEEEK
ncbi:MAG: methyltransferase domain-containing protein [Planctomycetaceae bacterium]|jgi:SAM-dependent methyltransferase|nr:methyltransferase domain-containing protein [Planctomycetaceae bacterium]